MVEREIDYDALAARLTESDAEIRGVEKALHGRDATEAGRTFLLREYGTEEALNAALRPGRPKVGQKHARGESPTVRGRIPEADFAAFKQLEEQTGKGQSELVREAVLLLLSQHSWPANAS
ncbi:hypothetical protein [Arthrobacter sp. H14-L1]|uniref:hypothetical protein n=1 Tax=Arthrobacter sp. H14-L1 TaxID=2996697 RepID=UPI00226F4379|nr:hypothetical protein [Arthrobacter sp. H14-L1]MCY0905455.1 hypothetical protein [Arthrobacter sp. H14-L1]